MDSARRRRVERFTGDRDDPRPGTPTTGHDPWRGTVSPRWVLVHMTEEYARHNGHADLLRERMDGAAGL